MSPYEEGRAAAEQRKTFRDHCPYAFNTSGLSRMGFDATMRPKMGEWFKGWKDWLDEHNLGFNFQPKMTGKRYPRKVRDHDGATALRRKE